jgi:hypothetical protein
LAPNTNNPAPAACKKLLRESCGMRARDDCLIDDMKILLN